MVDASTMFSEVRDTQPAEDRGAGERTAKAVQDRLHVPHLAWPAVEEKIVQIVVRLLDIKLLDAWLGAWLKYRELHALRDRDKYPPEKEIEVVLAEHHVISEHRPSISIELDGSTTGKPIEFDLRVEAKLEGICLSVQDARIKKLIAGRARAEATVKLGETVLWNPKTKPLQLGRPIDLGTGFEIP